MRSPVLKISSLAAAAILAVGALPAVAEAQSHAQVVWNQLNTLFERSQSDGYGSRNYIVGRMDDDASDSWTVTLQGGMTYRIVGACDADCDDVDIEVFENDKSIVKDILADDIPIVNFTASSTSRYTIKVSMASCKANPCFWGIGIFYK
jgi:hypothetical protein